MSADEVELMYVFLKEVQDEERAWFERVMGITWTYDQAMSMMSKPVAEGEEPKEQKPTLLGPGGKVHYPLSMALNGAMLKEVTGRFQRDASSMLTPDGELIQGENMFSWKKEDFLRQMGHDGQGETGIRDQQTPEFFREDNDDLGVLDGFGQRFMLHAKQKWLCSG